MNPNFELAQETLNEIDDYLEYAYRAHETVDGLRDRILEMLSEYTKKLSK